MRVLLIGGHGQVSLLLQPLLANRGDDVTAVIRNPDHEAAVVATGSSATVVDVEQASTEELAELLRGHDAVVWSAGAGADDAERTYTFDRDTAIRSIDAAVAAGVKRYVMVSFFFSGEHGVPEGDPFFAYADAKSTADAHLRDSGLDWTIVAPGLLTADGPTGRIDARTAQGGPVPRADVAAVVAATLADSTSIGRTYRFNSGETPIAEAIAG